MDLVYKSTLAGKASLLFWCLVGGVAMAYVADFSAAGIPGKPHEAALLTVCVIFLNTLGIGFMVMFTITLIYGWRTTAFKILGAGQTSVLQSYYDFPFSRVSEERIFDRIIAIRVEQAAIDLFFGSGTLVLTVVNFAGPDSAKSEIRIPYLSYVEDAKREIMASQPRGVSERSSGMAPQFG